MSNKADGYTVPHRGGLCVLNKGPDEIFNTKDLILALLEALGQEQGTHRALCAAVTPPSLIKQMSRAP